MKRFDESRRCPVCLQIDGRHKPRHKPLAAEPLTKNDWEEIFFITNAYMAQLHGIIGRARAREETSNVR